MKKRSNRTHPAEEQGNLQLWKMQLSLPDLIVHDSSEEVGIHEEDWVDNPLSVEELAEQQEELWDDIQAIRVNGMVKGEDTEWGEHQALVDEFKSAIHWDHDSSVLSGKFAWGPEGAPIRGPICEARVHLKVGAEARAPKQIQLQGERFDAMKEIADGWVANGRAESCSSNWRHPSFQIKKKNGPCRGVINLKWLNSQCKEDAYPLPRIEDLPVK